MYWILWHTDDILNIIHEMFYSFNSITDVNYICCTIVKTAKSLLLVICQIINVALLTSIWYQFRKLREI